jgi:hypothetical protein
MENAFLREFVKMRQTLGVPDTMSKGKGKVEKEKHLSGLSMASIIEKKPPAKDVLKYFRKKFGDESDSD